jgi:hypothetical protein
VSNEHLKLSLSMFIFGTFLIQYRTKVVVLDIKSMVTRRRIQRDHIQLLILKIEHRKSDFQIFLNLSGVVIGDLQSCMQLGAN